MLAHFRVALFEFLDTRLVFGRQFAGAGLTGSGLNGSGALGGALGGVAQLNGVLDVEELEVKRQLGV